MKKQIFLVLLLLLNISVNGEDKKTKENSACLNGNGEKLIGIWKPAIKDTIKENEGLNYREGYFETHYRDLKFWKIEKCKMLVQAKYKGKVEETIHNFVTVVEKADGTILITLDEGNILILFIDQKRFKFKVDDDKTTNVFKKG